MKVVGYSYPWDVADPGFIDRATGLGVDEVAVAMSYHSTRAATPWSPTSTSVIASRSALYRPVREAAWGRSALRPGTAAWLDDPDSAGTAIRRLNAAGLPAAAWIVLTHNSRLGTARPDLAVRNCFDETYPWGLCPSQPAVREYAATLTAECLAGLDVSTVVLESSGQMGVLHQCQHEKTNAVWSPALARLLSICCCSACAAAWTTDADVVRRALRDEARRLLSSGDLRECDLRLPSELLTELLAVRHAAAEALTTSVLAEIGADRSVALHGSGDPWATGALPGLPASPPERVGAVVLPNWEPGAAGVESVRNVRASLPDPVAVGSYVTAVGPDPADLVSHVRDLCGAGATELHLYHLGLAGPARWPDLQAATRTALEHDDLQLRS